MTELATYPIADLRIRVAVQAGLHRNTHFDMSDIMVDVDHGEVSLYGVVSRPAAAEAVADATAVEGVQLVRDGLTLPH
ncbi:BON domain-containing protein [Phenylobacterium sp. LjRoot225]|uniref:BON domain-containing protein n=1 Tax=Phenylobacterium sp. LjRoot225 TaxID=3342285 RepID=UPI003ECF5686